MPAYFVFEFEVTNSEAMAAYREAVPAIVAQYGGRFVVRGGATELVEGGPEPKRVVITEFMDEAAVASLASHFDVRYDPTLVDRPQELKALL